MAIIDKIMLELKQKNYHQKDLAKVLGLPAVVITDWKNGKSNSYMKYLPRIAEFLGVSVDYLAGTNIDEDWDKDIRDYLEALNKNGDLKFFVDYVKGATIEEVKETIEIAKALYKKRREQK